MPRCEFKMCPAESHWAVKSKQGDKEHFFCGRHITTGIRQTRSDKEEILTIRELFV